MSTTAPTTPSPPALPTETVLLGRLAIALAAHFPEWVRRRTTTFTFYDEKTLVQRMAVSIALPSETWFADGKGEDLKRLLLGSRVPDTIHVPLSMVTKGALEAFRIADASDGTVSMRNRVERCRMTVAAFSSLLDEYARRADPQAVPGAFHDSIDRIVSAPDIDEGARAYEAAMATDLGRLLRPGDPYLTLLQLLSSSFMMLVPVAFPSGDHLFHVKWDETLRWSNRRTLGGAAKLVGSSVGFWAKEFVFPDRRIGWAQSTHFVVEEPEDVHNLRTCLTEQTPAAGAAPRSHEVSGRPHADVSIPLRDSASPLDGSEDCAALSISFAPRRSGAFAAVTTVAWVSFALLYVIWRNLADVDLEASTTVAVVLPAILAASLVRQGEHAIAGLLLGGVRALGLLLVLLVFTAAAFMAATDSRAEPVRTPSAICHPAPQPRVVDAPLEVLLTVGPLGLAGPGRAMVCVVSDGSAARRVPPRGEERAVRLSMLGTLGTAIVLTIGMIATWARIAVARTRAPKRDGRALRLV